MKRLVLTSAALAAAFVFATPASAGDIDTLQALGQSEFHSLSKDLGAALSFKSLAPAATLGITGFDLGLAVTGTHLDSVAAWEKASGGSSVQSIVPVPTLRFAKGLPLNIDVGAFYMAMPSSNIRLYGGEVRWAFIAGNVAIPAVSIHATYGKLTGVDQLGLNTKSVDVSISKGFTVLTPYAGIGEVWTDSTPVNVPQLHGESITQTKYFAGLNLNFGLPNLALEVDQTGGITSYGAKFGLRW